MFHNVISFRCVSSIVSASDADAISSSESVDSETEWSDKGTDKERRCTGVSYENGVPVPEPFDGVAEMAAPSNWSFLLTWPASIV
jgi:hypothetical protein